MPNQNPFAMLMRSRKFLLAMADAIASSVLLLATRYLSPSDLDFVKQIVVIYQPVIVILIGSIAYEDKARMENPPVTQTTVTGSGTVSNPVIQTTQTQDAKLAS